MNGFCLKERRIFRWSGGIWRRVVLEHFVHGTKPQLERTAGRTQPRQLLQTDTQTSQSLVRQRCPQRRTLSKVGVTWCFSFNQLMMEHDRTAGWWPLTNCGCRICHPSSPAKAKWKRTSSLSSRCPSTRFYWPWIAPPSTISVWTSSAWNWTSWRPSLGPKSTSG